MSYRPFKIFELLNSPQHPIFFLAPMVGLTHVATREWVQAYTPSNIFLAKHTEMISTRRLPAENIRGPESLRSFEGEKNLIPQLLGNEQKYIAASIQKLIPIKPIAFDINMGCPVKHTLKHNWGVRLLGDKDYAANVVRYAKESTHLPVSVKLRVGLKDGNENDQEMFDFFVALQAAGVDWLNVHGRFAEQKHHGSAEWEKVQSFREKLKIPVVINGDIQCKEDIQNLHQFFNFDGIMLARGFLARPWILWQWQNSLNAHFNPPDILRHPDRAKFQLPQRAPQSPSEESQEFIFACWFFLELLEKYFDNSTYVIERFRFLIATTSKWHKFGHHFWSKSMKAKSTEDIRKLLLNKPLGRESMYQRVKL